MLPTDGAQMIVFPSSGRRPSRDRMTARALVQYGRRLALCIAWSSTICGCRPAAPALDSSVFRLIEERVVRLPPRTLVRYVSGDSTGRFVVAADDVPVMVFDSTGQRHELPWRPGKDLLGIDSRGCDSCVFALVNRNGQLAEIHAASGAILASWPYPVNANLLWLSAAHTSEGWVAGARTPESRIQVFLLSSKQPMRLVQDLGVLLSEVRDTAPPVEQSLTLRSTADGIIASLSWPPHQSFVLSAGGEILQVLIPDPGVALWNDEHDATTRLSLGVVAIDKGFLQVLADPGSDRRRLILFDVAGRQVRSRLLQAPWGLAGMLKSQSRLLALREMNPPEVVVYRYTSLRPH